VEGVGGVAAVRRGVRERSDHLEELDDRTRPAVRDDKRQGRGVRRANVDEVDTEPIDHRAELRQRIQPRLGGTPVVSVGPVAAEVLQIGEWDALRPVLDRLALGPSCALQPRAEVLELSLGDLDAELRHLVRHRCRPVHLFVPPGMLPASGAASTTRPPGSIKLLPPAQKVRARSGTPRRPAGAPAFHEGRRLRGRADDARLGRIPSVLALAGALLLRAWMRTRR
jgi:hypothetical protein